MRPQPRSTEAARASRDAGRGRAYPEFDDNGRPIAANIQSPSDAELLGFIQRALDGDPYPVSGRSTPAFSEAIDAEPLTSRIRDILQSGSPAHPIALEPASEATPVADELPTVSEADKIDISPPVEAPPATAKGNPRRRWVFGFGSIATVVGCAVAGALIPTLLAAPPHYRSQTVLQLQGDGVERQALLEATAKRIASASLLSRTVAKLKLDRDPEFTGEKAGALGVAMDLLSGSGSASDAPSRAQAALRGDIAVATDPATGTLRLSVTSEVAAKSAEIANRLADAAIYDATVAHGAGSAANRGAADASRVVYEKAKAALAAFEAQTGDDKIKAAVELQRQQQQLYADIKAAETDVQAAKARVAAAKSTTLANVLGGAVSSDLSSAGLDDLRGRYVAAKTVLSQLSTQLGPRHPRLLAQQATIDGLTASIRDQLQRLVATSDADLKSALDKRNALSGRMTALSQRKSDVDMARFTQLQATVATAQGEFEASLRNSTTVDTSEIEVPIAVVSSAVAASAPLDDDLVGMQAAGFFLGLGGAFCLVFLRKWITDVTMADEPAAEHLPAPETTAAYHDEPELRFQPSDEPPLHSVAATAVDESDAVVEDEMAHIRDAMASLRAKVETYALRRHVAQP